MYPHQSIKELYAQPKLWLNQEVSVCGWARTIRDQKNFAFIDLNDGSHFLPLQIVFEREGSANYEEVVRAGNGAALVIKGKLVETPQQKNPIELKATEIFVEGSCPSDYPLQPKRHSPEFLRSIAHLRVRTNLYSAIFRLRSEAAFALHQFFHDRGFVYVHTPIITSSDSEGAGEMFQVTTLPLHDLPKTEEGAPDFSKDFFGKETKLTVSGQLNVETYVQAFQKVYTFWPTFRAEKSNTARHAAEFWMIEPEIAFADLEDDMQLAKDMLQFVIRSVLSRCPDEIAFFTKFVDKEVQQRLELVANSDFARITYTEAIEILKQAKVKFKFPVEWGKELQTEHERYLTEVVFQKPLFVTDYPKDIKAFYMRLNDDGKTVAAMDCLVPGIGEIIGGSQREERYDLLLQRIQELGLEEESYRWYLDLRRFGSTHHAGFGLGFERLIMYLSGVANIRDVIPFPRTTGTADY